MVSHLHIYPQILLRNQHGATKNTGSRLGRDVLTALEKAAWTCTCHALVEARSIASRI